MNELETIWENNKSLYELVDEWTNEKPVLEFNGFVSILEQYGLYYEGEEDAADIYNRFKETKHGEIPMGFFITVDYELDYLPF